MYEYGNARIRAMKGRLLGRWALEGLVECADATQVLAALAQTDYASDVSAALAKRGGVEAVDEAIRLNLVRTTRAIQRFYEGEARDLVGVLVERYDVQNVVTVLRARAARASPEEIVEVLLPCGQLGEAALVELARQPDVKGVVDTLATWRHGYARPLTAALREYGQSGDLAVLEVALVRYAYGRALDRLESGGRNVRGVRRVLGDEIDALNVTTALRVCGQPNPPPAEDLRRQFVERGSRLDVAELLALCDSGGVDRLLGRLRQTPLGAALNGALGPSAATGSIAPVQRALEMHLIRERVRLFHGNPLGIDLVVAYLAAKTAEVANLRLIARGIALGLERDEILEQVWVP